MARATVLVVSYNHEPYVEQCLNSVRGQTESAELIVVDDASKDRTAEVIRTWIERTGHPVRFIPHSVNVGLGHSLAEGLSMVRTPFMAYLAGDDWMEPGRIRLQVEAMEAHGPTCALSYSDVYRADMNGNRLEPTLAGRLGDDWHADTADHFQDLLRGNWVPAPSVMVRTDALRAVGGYDPEIFYEDHDVVLRLARDFGVAVVPQPLATHRELADSLGHRMFYSQENRAAWLRAKVLILRKHLGRGPESDGIIASRMGPWLRELYLRGEDPAWVSSRVAEVEEHVRLEGLGPGVALAVHVGVPGRLVGVALGGARRVRGLRRSGRPTV